MSGEPTDLYLAPPPELERALSEIHDILVDEGDAQISGFFTLPDGSTLFHVVCGTSVPAWIELRAIAAGWTSQPRPD